MASANALILSKRLADGYFAGAFKLLLVSSLPSETDLDTFDFRSDIANEVTGAGYTAGGVAVTLTVGSPDATTNRTPVTIGNLAPALAAASVSAVGGWLYKVAGSAATDELVQFLDFEGTITSTGGPFNVTFTAPLYINR